MKYEKKNWQATTIKTCYAYKTHRIGVSACRRARKNGNSFENRDTFRIETDWIFDLVVIAPYAFQVDVTHEKSHTRTHNRTVYAHFWPQNEQKKMKIGMKWTHTKKNSKHDVFEIICVCVRVLASSAYSFVYAIGAIGLVWICPPPSVDPDLDFFLCILYH